MYVYVCMCVCMYVCMITYMYICTHIYIYTFVCVCVCILTFKNFRQARKHLVIRSGGRSRHLFGGPGENPMMGGVLPPRVRYKFSQVNQISS